MIREVKLGVLAVVETKVKGEDERAFGIVVERVSGVTNGELMTEYQSILVKDLQLKNLGLG